MPDVLEPRINCFPKTTSERGLFSSSTILARVSKGVGALSLGAAVRGIGQIIIVPVALFAWGELRYGEWVLLTGLVSILGITEFGLQTFVANRLCASYVHDNREGMQRVLHSALRLQGPLVVGLAILIGLALLVIPLDHLLSLRTISGLELFGVVILLALELLICIPVGIMGALYRATGRLVRGAMIWGMQQLILIGFTVSLIAGNAKFWEVAAARVGIVLVSSGWVIYDLRRSYPWITIWPSTGTWREGLRMIGPGLVFLFITMADYLSNQFTLVVVQKVLDGGEVSRLATHRMIPTGIQLVSILLMYAVWPELSAMSVRLEHERLRRFHRSLAKLNIWLIGGTTFALLPFIPWIYSTWTTGHLDLDVWTLAFLLVRALIWGMWYASLTLLLATDRHRYVAPVLFGTAVLTGLMAIPLVWFMGISGAALATLMGDVCITAWLIPGLAARSTGDTSGAFLKEISMALLLAVGLPAALGFTAWLFIPSPAFRYLVIIPTCGGLALLSVWRQLGFQERQLAWDVYQRALSFSRS